MVAAKNSYRLFHATASEDSSSCAFDLRCNSYWPVDLIVLFYARSGTHQSGTDIDPNADGFTTSVGES